MIIYLGKLRVVSCAYTEGRAGKRAMTEGKKVDYDVMLRRFGPYSHSKWRK